MLHSWLRPLFRSAVRRPSRRLVDRKVPLQVERLAERTTPSLIAACGFDEGTGTTVTDASGNGHPGTISGATWTTAGLLRQGSTEVS